jgi:hypothetical protein
LVESFALAKLPREKRVLTGEHLQWLTS